MLLKEKFVTSIGRMQAQFGRTPAGFRRVAAMLVDAAIVIESFAVALLFRSNGEAQREFWGAFWGTFWPFAVFSAAVFVALLYESGVYQSILRYTGIYQGVRTASATLFAAGIIFIADYALGELMGLRPVPLSVVLAGSILAYVQLVAVRLYPRVFYELSLREVGRQKRAVIVGTGEPGVALADYVRRTPALNARVVGFLSESATEVGRGIEGTSVLGVVDDLGEVIQNNGVDQVIVATAQADRDQMDMIWRTCMESGVEIRVMPDLEGLLAEGTLRLRELQIEDLLGREPVQIDVGALAGYINGKRVLVTGAGGSIGSELCRQISRLGPSRLVLLDRDESALHYLNEELVREGFGSAAEVCVGDVSVPERVDFIFERARPEIVFHAAAYKHVPIMELQVTEAVLNNVGGTLNIARAAGEHGVGKFINVSTDKAVNPANVMGATKRLSETLVQSLAEEYPETVYASVRFGNVLGSRGSVVPTFKRQIEVGGPVTVTHPEMIRFFMTIPEAVSLILQSGAMARGYGTYVLEMGRPVKILDLARKMIQVTGAQHVQIKFTGLRPGEKLREELVEKHEVQAVTDHPMILRLIPEDAGERYYFDVLSLTDETVQYARAQNSDRTAKLLRHLVPTYPAIASLEKEPSDR